MSQPSNANRADRAVRSLPLALLVLVLAACGESAAPSGDAGAPDVEPVAGLDDAAPLPADDATECSPGLADGWARQGPPGMPMLAGFGTLRNACEAAVTVVSASSPAFGAVELHETRMGEDGVSRMRPVPRLAIAPGETATLAPGGLHLMLMQPVNPLEAGQRVEVTFVLDDGREIAGQLEVRNAN